MLQQGFKINTKLFVSVSIRCLNIVRIARAVQADIFYSVANKETRVSSSEGIFIRTNFF